MSAAQVQVRQLAKPCWCRRFRLTERSISCQAHVSNTFTSVRPQSSTFDSDRKQTAKCVRLAVLGSLPWVRADRIGRGFRGDLRGPVEKGEDGKNKLWLSSQLIFSTRRQEKELMQTVALLLWAEECLESLSLRVTLTYFPIHQLCLSLLVWV